jgi:hypothetical protein
VLYRTYIDDSSDEKQQIVMIAGALMGTHKQWRAVTQAWRKRLKQDGLRYFRSTEYFSLRGEFERFRDPVRYPKPKGSESAKKLRDDLEAILQTQVLGLGCVIPIKDLRDVIEENQLHDRFNPDPFSFAMQTVMRECARAAQSNLMGENNKVAFVCDDSPNSAKLTAAYSAFKRSNQPIRDTLGGMVHLDDKKTPALQAADMVASVAKEVALEHLKRGEQVSLPRLQGVFWKLVGWNKESILRIALRQ